MSEKRRMANRWDDGLPQASRLFRFCGWEIRCPYDDGSMFDRGAGYYAVMTKPTACHDEPGRGVTSLFMSDTELYPTAELAQYRAIRYVAEKECMEGFWSQWLEVNNEEVTVW